LQKLRRLFLCLPTGLYFPVWSFFFLSACAAQAAMRPFWYDEIYTFTISRLSLTDIFRALATGTDLNPPGQYVVLAGVYRLFGASEFTTRLLALVGFWLGCYCLFRYGRQRAGAAWGIVCASIPAISYARFYATDGRPYGMLFGCAAWAFLSWAGRRRIQVAIALALGLSFHYYAVLTWIPLVLGEIGRARFGRKFDAWMWLAFLGGAAPLAAFPAFLEAARRFTAFFWARPRLGLIGAFYWKLVGAPLAAAVLLTLAVTRGKRVLRIAGEETVAAVGFALLFVFQFGVAVFVTHAFYLSYGITAILGLALLAIHVSVWKRGWVAIPLCIALFAFDTGADVFQALQRRYPDPLPREVTALSESLPIVVTTPHEFLEMDHYGLHERVVWLSDVARSMRHWGNASDTHALLALKQWRPLHIEDYQTFINRGQPFFVYGTGWVVKEIASNPRLHREQVSPLCWRVSVSPA
jgi:hypothetical protein